MPAPTRIFGHVRALCLSFPEASEVSAWGHPNFRVRRKAFVAFEQVQKRPSIAFRLDPLEVERLLERKAFFATPYGRGLWVSVWVDRAVSQALLDRLAQQAYRVVAGKRLSALLDQSRKGARPRYESVSAPRAGRRRRSAAST
jgi:predicted DNA-binding protein (MmcQ/YjbR family)